jgi:hypothetical protein
LHFDKILLNYKIQVIKNIKYILFVYLFIYHFYLIVFLNS